MTNEEKLKVFEYYLELIQSKSIKEFTKFCLINCPDYFYTLPASSTGKNHGKGETLIDHVNACLFVADNVSKYQFKGIWTERQRDQLLSSLILHDCWRAGNEGEELRISQEYIDKKGLPQELLGNLSTTHDHPEIGFKNIIRLSVEYNGLEGVEKIAPRDLDVISKAVKYHYGPFTKGTKFSLSWPYDTVVTQTHNIDYHQSLNSRYLMKRE